MLDKLECKHGSWLNIGSSACWHGNVWLVVADIDTLRNEVSAWMEQRNRTQASGVALYHR